MYPYMKKDIFVILGDILGFSLGGGICLEKSRFYSYSCFYLGMDY
jgi:hypothetical protein